MLTQHLHHLVALRSGHLNHRAQFFVEQRLKCEFFASGTHLLCPVFAVAMVSAAVAHAIPLGDQQIDVQVHADASGKSHFADRGPQTAIAFVVVGQEQTLLTQIIDGMHQMQQVLRVVKVGGIAACLIQNLRQHAGTHALLAASQIDQDQAAVLGGVKLRCEVAPYIVQSHKRGDDQTHRRCHLALCALFAPTGAHRQAVFAHRNGDAQGWTQLQPHGFDGVVQGRVFAHLAASGHPVGRQLHFV